MKYEEGARVEVSGDPEDPGFAGSWWTAVVVRQQRRGRGAGQITVRYDELLEDDGVTKAEETLHFSRVRPACADDSCTKPLADRQPGDPVDCWHDDGWWEGYVHKVFDDHLTVFFPASNEEYTDICPPAKPLDPAAHRVRTGRNWDVEQRAWVARPRRTFDGSANHRTRAAAAAAAAPLASASNAAGTVGRTDRSSEGKPAGSSSSSSSEEDVPLIARKATLAGTPNGGQRAPKGAPSKAAQPSAKPGVAKPPAAAAVPTTAAPQPAAQQTTKQAASGDDGSSSEDEPLVFRVRAAAQAAEPRAQQQQAQQQPSPAQQHQKQQAQRQQQEPPAAQRPAEAAAKQGGGPSTAAAAAAGKAAAATAHKASESPEGGLAAANASVADLLTSLDVGDEDEERRDGSNAAAAAAPPAMASMPGPAAPGATGAAAAAAKQAAPAAAAAAAKQAAPTAAAAKQVAPTAAAVAAAKQVAPAASAKQVAPAAAAAAAKQVAPAAAAAAAKQVAPAAAAAAAKPRVEASAPAAAGAPAATPQAAAPAARAAADAPAAAAAAAKPEAPSPRQQSAPKPSVQRQQPAPKQPLQRQQSAPARPAPLQLPTSLGDLKAPAPKRQQQQQQQQQQAESPLHRQQSDLQLPTSLAGLKAPPPKRQRQDVLQTEPRLQKQLSDVQQRKQAQAQQARPEQRQQDVRQPPATQAQQQDVWQPPATQAQQQQQQAAVAGRGKAAPAAKPVHRSGGRGAGRPGGGQPSIGKAAAAASGGAQRLAPLIPKRAAAGEGGTLESPRALPSPRQQQPPPPPPPQQQSRQQRVETGGEAAARKRPREERDAADAVMAATAGVVQADGDRKRGRSEGPAPPPGALPAPAAAAAVARPAAQQRQPEAQYDPTFPTVWCMDNLPAAISSTVLRQALQGIGMAGVKSVEVAAVPLDVGDRHGGYAVLRFVSAADAQRQYDKLHSLCIRTSTCPIPRPLVIRQPRVREGYAWGPEARLPGHFPLDFQANQHFVQPNSIEFDLAIEWRQALGQLAAAKQELCMEQAMELAEEMAGYLKALGQLLPPIVPARLQLPGEVLGPSGGVAAGQGAASASSCVWLSGVLASATEEQLMEAFAQFGFPQQAHLVQDPVTGKPSSHAVLWMESNQRARDLVQNLREMVYVLNGTPRAVDASLAVPGPARGSQSTYDRALRCLCGADDSQLAGSVDFVFVKDEELLELPAEAELGKLPAADRADAAARRATIALRRLLRSHRKEQDELADEKRQRLRALDARQRQHFADEKMKLGRLAAIQHQQIEPSLYLIDHLLDRHNIKGVRVYRNKESAKLMRYVDEQRAAQQRAAAEQQRAALKQRAPARHDAPQQRGAVRPRR